MNSLLYLALSRPDIRETQCLWMLVFFDSCQQVYLRYLALSDIPCRVFAPRTDNGSASNLSVLDTCKYKLPGVD